MAAGDRYQSHRGVEFLQSGSGTDAGVRRRVDYQHRLDVGIIVNRGLDQAHYNCSKAGVIHLSKSLAMEWVDKGIRVNSISPGYTATPMNTRPEMVHQTREFESQTPMQRMAKVEEMAGPALFLASDAASFCTGVDLVVDGGFVCW